MRTRLHFIRTTALVGAVLLTGASLVAAQSYQSEHYQVAVETIADDIVHPWGLALLPDGRFLVTERDDGHLRLGTRDGQLSEPLDGVPEVFRFIGETDRSQGGLFDVKLHPDFESNQLVYLSFSKPTERGAAVAIVRGRMVEEDGIARLAEVEEIFEMKEEDQDSSGLHFGGRMAFHPEDGTLFLSIGERRNISRSQDLEDQAGSILRMTDTGNVPEDNPFVGQAGVDEYIYSYGHRNIQAIGFHPETHELWVADHGPEGGDEINRIEAGENYGWPFLTGGVDYSGAAIGVGLEHEGMVSPLYVFEDTLAPSGLMFYDGEMFSEWQGNMLIGGLAGQTLARVTIDDGQVGNVEWMLQDVERRMRDVAVADDGAVWVITEHENGEVLRLTLSEEIVGGME